MTRPLNRRTSDGYDVADFAEMRGHPFLPWQRWAAIHALELLPDGSYRFYLTDLPASCGPLQVSDFYRVRWEIESDNKLDKSCNHIDKRHD